MGIGRMRGCGNPNSLPSITLRLGSSKNPSPAGAGPVIGPPPARQWRKQSRNCRKGWTSWRCCQPPQNASDRRLVIGSSVAELVAEGRLSPATTYVPPAAPDLSGIRKRAGDYEVDALAERMSNADLVGNAVEHYQQFSPQLSGLVYCRSVRHSELEFRSSVGAALRLVKGQAVPETGQAFARARELWEQLGSPAEYLHVPYGQSRYHIYRGELDLAMSLDEDLLRLSRQRNDPRGLVLSLQSYGLGQMLAGGFASSRSNLEAVLALYDPTSHHSLGYRTGSHPQVNSQAVLGIVLFCLGFPDQALAGSSAAIAEARRLAHPPSLAVSLFIGAILHLLDGEIAALDERAGELIGVTTEHGFPFWRAVGTIYRGWVKVKNGDVAGGIPLLRSSSSACRATGSEAWVTYHIALLARACESAGQVEEGLTLLDEALQIVERTGERWFAAELAQRPAAAAARASRGRRGTVSQSPEHRRGAGGQAMGIARRREPRPVAPRPGPPRRSPRPAYTRLRLVHGRLRHPNLKEAKTLLDELA